MQDFDLAKLPLDDRASYELLTKAKTVAVFQLESRGMQGMLKDARPDRFEDIIALVALYRPGPMDLIPDFCKRKHGEKFDYPDPRTEGILSETYGIMVYQEQVMQMAQVVGGYSLGGADLLRRAMGKKKPKRWRSIVRSSVKVLEKVVCLEEKADEIFDLMENSRATALINRMRPLMLCCPITRPISKPTIPPRLWQPICRWPWTIPIRSRSWSKTRLMCASSRCCHPISISLTIVSCRWVNRAKATQIRYGMGAVKGSGQNAIENIVNARKEGGPFTDLFDFCKRVDKRQVNRRTIESLIRAGAMDCLGQDRAVLLASVDFAMEVAEQAEASANQVSLFGDDDDMIPPPEYVKADH